MTFQIKIANPGTDKFVGDKIKFSSTYTSFNPYHVKTIHWTLGENGATSTSMYPSYRYTFSGVKKIKCVINGTIVMQLSLTILDVPDVVISGIRLNIINISGQNNLNVVLFQKNLVGGFDDPVVAWTVIDHLNNGRNRNIIFGDTLSIGYKKIDTLSSIIPVTPGQQIIANEDYTVGVNGTAESVNEIEILSNVFTLAAITGRLYRTERLLMQVGPLDNGSTGYFRAGHTLWIGILDGISQGDIMGSDVLSQFNTEISLLGISSADVVISGGSEGAPFQFTLQNIVYA